jgi:hypothetical protein
MAADQVVIDGILESIRGLNVRMMTAVPAALVQVFGSASLTLAGERVEGTMEAGCPSWRSYPIDGSDEVGSLTHKDQHIPYALLPAFAAAVCDPDAVPNLLNALPNYRKTFFRCFSDVLTCIVAAVALCFGALGFHFQRDATRERNELVAARVAERTLWGRFLPAEEPHEGRLLKTMRTRLADLGEGAGASEFPSALAFWSELGKHMPNPDALSLTLESLDLAPDGGRISARMPALKEDPLKNATQVEGALNGSKNLTARGDYEVRDGQVQVRLRMDYKP